ncbi:unnamed protein product [Amoebophrya sp. A120]|nr:unnamed protein product [Amoebophrya sp. A120]|eukprot:GSA120T00003823001.1
MSEEMEINDIDEVQVESPHAIGEDGKHPSAEPRHFAMPTKQDDFPSDQQAEAEEAPEDANLMMEDSLALSSSSMEEDALFAARDSHFQGDIAFSRRLSEDTRAEICPTASCDSKTTPREEKHIMETTNKKACNEDEVVLHERQSKPPSDSALPSPMESSNKVLAITPSTAFSSPGLDAERTNADAARQEEIITEHGAVDAGGHGIVDIESHTANQTENFAGPHAQHHAAGNVYTQVNTRSLCSRTTKAHQQQETSYSKENLISTEVKSNSKSDEIELKQEAVSVVIPTASSVPESLSSCESAWIVVDDKRKSCTEDVEEDGLDSPPLRPKEQAKRHPEQDKDKKIVKAPAASSADDSSGGACSFTSTSTGRGGELASNVFGGSFSRGLPLRPESRDALLKQEFLNKLEAFFTKNLFWQNLLRNCFHTWATRVLCQKGEKNLKKLFAPEKIGEQAQTAPEQIRLAELTRGKADAEEALAASESVAEGLRAKIARMEQKRRGQGSVELRASNNTRLFISVGTQTVGAEVQDRMPADHKGHSDFGQESRALESSVMSSCSTILSSPTSMVNKRITPPVPGPVNTANKSHCAKNSTSAKSNTARSVQNSATLKRSTVSSRRATTTHAASSTMGTKTIPDNLPGTSCSSTTAATCSSATTTKTKLQIQEEAQRELEAKLALKDERHSKTELLYKRAKESLAAQTAITRRCELDKVALEKKVIALQNRLEQWERQRGTASGDSSTQNSQLFPISGVPLSSPKRTTGKALAGPRLVQGQPSGPQIGRSPVKISSPPSVPGSNRPCPRSPRVAAAAVGSIGPAAGPRGSTAAAAAKTSRMQNTARLDALVSAELAAAKKSAKMASSCAEVASTAVGTVSVNRTSKWSNTSDGKAALSTEHTNNTQESAEDVVGSASCLLPDRSSASANFDAADELQQGEPQIPAAETVKVLAKVLAKMPSPSRSGRVSARLGGVPSVAVSTTREDPSAVQAAENRPPDVPTQAFRTLADEGEKPGNKNMKPRGCAKVLSHPPRRASNPAGGLYSLPHKAAEFISRRSPRADAAINAYRSSRSLSTPLGNGKSLTKTPNKADRSEQAASPSIGPDTEKNMTSSCANTLPAATTSATLVSARQLLQTLRDERRASLLSSTAGKE